MKNPQKTIGIVSYGSYIPRNRIRIAEIAAAWGKNAQAMEKSLGIIEKTVAGNDEDTITLAVNAANTAVAAGKIDPVKIGAVYTGSESHPYAVKSSSAIIAEALGIGNNYTAADLEFACKAGTAGMQMVCGLVASGMIEYGLAIGADTAQSRPGDALEYAAAAAASAFIIGSKASKLIAEIVHTTSFTSDTPDFWRREHEQYPSHAGRFTGEPAYFKHVASAIRQLLAESKMDIAEFDHIVLHMPNARFPKTLARELGISDKQLSAGFTVPLLGNSYSACSMTALGAVLDAAKVGEKILMCSYGSGSGSDAFYLKVTSEIKIYNNPMPLARQIKAKRYISYADYLRTMNKIKL